MDDKKYLELVTHLENDRFFEISSAIYSGLDYNESDQEKINILKFFKKILFELSYNVKNYSILEDLLEIMFTQLTFMDIQDTSIVKEESLLYFYVDMVNWNDNHQQRYRTLSILFNNECMSRWKPTRSKKNNKNKQNNKEIVIMFRSRCRYLISKLIYWYSWYQIDGETFLKVLEIGLVNEDVTYLKRIFGAYVEFDLNTSNALFGENILFIFMYDHIGPNIELLNLLLDKLDKNYLIKNQTGLLIQIKNKFKEDTEFVNVLNSRVYGE